MADLAELEPLIVQEWMNRPPGKRTENDIFPFYGYLLKERVHLLAFAADGDKYRTIREIVRKHL